MSDLDDPRVFFAAERTLLAWNRTGVALMAFGFVLERFGPFLHVLRGDPGHPGRGLSFWIGIAFIVLALVVLGLAAVQFRRVLGRFEFPVRYCTWCGMTMSLSVVALGIALLVYLFSEL